MGGGRPAVGLTCWVRYTFTQMRRTDIDGLRILICAGIILQHALHIFAAEPRYHLKSVELSLTASAVFEFFRATTMPAFFVIAGWSAVVSLRRRSPGRFVSERTLRLLVPLVTGIVLFGSIIKYIELSQGRDLGLHGFRLVDALQVGFFEFFPRYLTHWELLTWSHLWFLLYLFLITVLLLPPLVWLARSAPRTTVPAAFAVYLPALPMAALLVAFNGYWPYFPNLVTDWNNFGYYALCVAIGAGIAAWPGFEVRLRREAPRLLALTGIAFASLVLCGESAAGRLFVGLTAWGAIGAGLGYAARIDPPATPVFTYLSEATQPVYIVHHVILLLLALAILPLAIPVWFKIVLIWLGATVIVMAAYHWLIRPWPPVRWLMGMAPQIPKAMHTSATEPPLSL